ncbi:MAG: hypothetical protein HZC10_09600 [Nitrospirae bacterium]|nr:hypothetical protein [Nitrospirota bacterium]
METSWKPISRISLFFGALTAIAFWFHALTDKDNFLILDYVNLPFHEFGHLFFGIFGRTIGIWGGTIAQLLMPSMVLASFWRRRETSGVAFSIFWIGENLLYISVYIADARSRLLPLVGGGEHDWNIILSGMDMLQYDTVLSGIVKALGWIIMIAAIAWLVVKTLRAEQPST